MKIIASQPPELKLPKPFKPKWYKKDDLDFYIVRLNLPESWLKEHPEDREITGEEFVFDTGHYHKGTPMVSLIAVDTYYKDPKTEVLHAVEFVAEESWVTFLRKEKTLENFV